MLYSLALIQHMPDALLQVRINLSLYEFIVLSVLTAFFQCSSRERNIDVPTDEIVVGVVFDTHICCCARCQFRNVQHTLSLNAACVFYQCDYVG
jgi:hypothetical protein